jgi:hypothetical protein
MLQHSQFMSACSLHCFSSALQVIRTCTTSDGMHSEIIFRYLICHMPSFMVRGQKLPFNVLLEQHWTHNRGKVLSEENFVPSLPRKLALSVMLLSCIWEVIGSVTWYKWLSFFLIHLGICWDNTLNLATSISFKILSSLLFINCPTIRSYVASAKP